MAYFGATDGWCPLSLRDEIHSKVPCMICETDTHNTSHAFVYDGNEVVARMMWRHMQKLECIH